MTDTPIVDFVDRYVKDGTDRFHMPGHKGKCHIGPEGYDITEIKGADSLFEADGIIAESEKNAGEVFASDCFYSTEGSSLCIRTMLCLVKQFYGEFRLFAARNAHKAFVSACILLNIDVDWIDGDGDASYLTADISETHLEYLLKNSKQNKVLYITSPDYLGNRCDISAISRICKRYGCLLIVDNAHGAYLNFFDNMHPISQGADMCCDSAHKTLPVLTGGAYLHISKAADGFFAENAKNAMALFASTSPSYLILRSLDAFNGLARGGFEARLKEAAKKASELKGVLIANGFSLIGDEPLKITVDAKEYGYYGTEIADILRKSNIECEFADRDFIVLMLSCDNTDEELARLKSALISIPKKSKVCLDAPALSPMKKGMSMREAFFSHSEVVSVEDSVGRTVAQYNVACPPAVAIAVCGEVVNESAKKAFEYYGIKEITVVKE